MNDPQPTLRTQEKTITVSSFIEAVTRALNHLPRRFYGSNEPQPHANLQQLIDTLRVEHRPSGESERCDFYEVLFAKLLRDAAASAGGEADLLEEILDRSG